MKSDFFELADAATDDKGKPNPQAKQLLETIVLTNISSLVGALDVGGSEKLKTFRALGTNISEVTFADGV
jgi:hypothetical protein